MAATKLIPKIAKFLSLGWKGIKNPSARKAFVSIARKQKVGRVFVNKFTAFAARTTVRSTRFMKSKTAKLFKNHKGLKILVGTVGTSAAMGVAINFATEYMSGNKSAAEALLDINGALPDDSQLTRNELDGLTSQMVESQTRSDDFAIWLAMLSPVSTALKATLEPFHSFLDISDEVIDFDVENTSNALLVPDLSGSDGSSSNIINQIQIEFKSVRNLTNEQVIFLINRGSLCQSEEYLSNLAVELGRDPDSRLSLVEVASVYDNFILQYLGTMSGTWPVLNIIILYLFCLGYYASYVETNIISPEQDPHLKASGVFIPPMISSVIDGIEVGEYREQYLSEVADDGLVTDSDSFAANASAAIQQSAVVQFAREKSLQGSEGKTDLSTMITNSILE